MGGAGSCCSGEHGCIRDVFRGGSGLRTTLGSLSAHGCGCVFPSCLLFDLKHPRTGAYRLLGGVILGCQNGDLQKSSCRWIFPWVSATSVLVTTESHSHPPPPLQESLPDQQVGLAQAPMESLLCPESKFRYTLMFTLQEWSLFLPVLWSSWSQALLAFNVKSSVGSSSWCPIPWLGSLMWGSELSFTLWYNYFIVCGSPTWQVWDLITSWKHHPTISLLLLLWM